MSALRFDHLRSTSPRTEPVRAIVLHWTGGTRPPSGVYETLRSRRSRRCPDGLSVHYVVGVGGEVVQMAALDRVCLHAGVANAWSVGIEVVCPGRAGSAAHARELRRGIVRREYDQRLRGRRRPYRALDYTPAQAEAVTLLCEELCDRLALPRAVPLDADGSLVLDQLTDEELARFVGVMGHYHAHDVKQDPGVAPLEMLRRRWVDNFSAG